MSMLPLKDLSSVIDMEGHEGFFFDSKAPGLVISRRYGRVKPAKNQGGLASPLRYSPSTPKGLISLEQQPPEKA
jgi:hypothetical protein